MYQLTHVAEERLEDYARMDCAPSLDFSEIQEHVALCEICQERLSEIYEYVEFLHATPCESVGQVVRRHELECGTVFLIVSGGDAMRWQAHALGIGMDIVREFLRGARAKAFLDEWFAMTYSGHHCGTGCSSGWK